MNPNWKQIVREHLAVLRLPPEREIEIVEEQALHLEAAYEDALADGLPEAEAEARALRSYDWRLLECELSRAERPPIARALQPPLELIERKGRMRMESLLQDLRFGARMLAKQPSFTLIAALTLALGIGANTAIFSVVDALLLKRLQVEHPERLVTLAASYPGEGGTRSVFVYQTFERLRDQTRVFAELSAVCQLERFNLTIQTSRGEIGTGQARVELVSGNYFSTMGVRAAIGRTFTTDDDRTHGGGLVVVLSHAFWRRRLSSDAEVIGRALALNGVTYTIVGVTPAGFTGEWVGQPTDLWFPMAMQSQIMPEQPGLMTMPNSPTWARIIARLRPGVTIGQAETGAQTVFAQWMADTFSAAALQRMGRARLALEPAAQGYSPERKLLARPLVVLFALVGLVLLIACANIANLLLRRAIARRRETAVRLALGATPSRIARQLLVESGLLAIFGGIAGLLFAQWGARALTHLIASGNQPL